MTIKQARAALWIGLGRPDWLDIYDGKGCLELEIDAEAINPETAATRINNILNGFPYTLEAI